MSAEIDLCTGVRDGDGAPVTGSAQLGLTRFERALGRMFGVAGLVGHRNTVESPRRLISTSVGIGFAVFVAISQIGFLIGFISASELVVHAAKAAIWIVPPNVKAIEYPSSIERRLGDRIVGLTGVRTVEPLVVGWRDWRASEFRGGVALVGAPAGRTGQLPVPLRAANSSWAAPIAVNEKSGKRLGLFNPGDRGEIGGHAVEVTDLLNGFASYLGGPYVFVDFRDAEILLGIEPESAHFLLVYTAPGTETDMLTQQIQEVLPEQQVMTSDEFAASTSRYWLGQTGAGGGFVLTAILGFGVGIVVVSQALYTSVVNRQREYGALAAIGADASMLRRIVMAEALMCGVLGGIVGFVLSFPGVWAMQEHVVAWIEVPFWLRLSAIAGAVVMASLAATVALRTVTQRDPAAVLRG